MGTVDIAWLGHATLDMRMPTGGRFLTDPVLRDHCAHLRRHRGTAQVEAGTIDAVLISHLHHDHLDIPSLKRLPNGTPLLVPKGTAKLVAKTGNDVMEVAIGDSVDIAGTRLTVVPAEHQGGRFLTRVKGAPIGYLLEAGGVTVYFPGDTDLHPAMSDLPRPDVALLPIAGWGPTLGPGHLDAERAATAAALLDAKAVLPIHWGTFAPRHHGRREPEWLDRPAERVAAAMAREAPGTALHLVRPGPSVHVLG